MSLYSVTVYREINSLGEAKLDVPANHKIYCAKIKTVWKNGNPCRCADCDCEVPECCRALGSSCVPTPH